MERPLALLLMLTLIGGVGLPVFAQEAVPESGPEAFSLPHDSLEVDSILLTEPDSATSTPVVTPEAEETTPLDTGTSLTEGAPSDVTELIVKFEEADIDLEKASGRREADATVAETGAVLEERLTEANSVLISVSDSQDADEVIEQLEDDASVEYAEPNYARSFSAIASNDPRRAQQWALENTGQSVNSGPAGTPDADIDAPEAWALSTGTSTIVAVIDNGVLYDHPDLSANMWDGSTCVSDTGAALGGCLHGYDFDDNDLSPMPTTTTPFPSTAGHGTLVAGIIAAEMNNATGTIGVAPHADVMALRFGLDVASEVRAIDFARENGARIINASFGGVGFSQAEYDAIERFQDAGGIFIAAAGNDAEDIDDTPIYPASYDLPGIVSVVATTQADALASYSSFGEVSADLGAPGDRIVTTSTSDGVNGGYAYVSGTSMAAPQVAGAAALLRSLYPDASVPIIKEALLAAGDAAAALSGKTVSGKRLNAYGSLAFLGTDTTPPVITLSGSATVSLTTGASYTEAGATAIDARDGVRPVAVGGDVVDTSVAATYTVTYAASDLSNNTAQAVRTVTVTAPVVSSGGGGGGGGGGSSKKSSKAKTKAKEKAKPVKPETKSVPAPVTNPARPLLTPTVPAAATTSSAPAFTFVRLLTVGSAGPDVTALQEALTRAGIYFGPVTGYFGPLTSTAVRSYQSARGLDPVGFVGPMTRSYLNQGR